MSSRHDSHSEYLRDIQAQIRAEADLLRERSPLPRAPAPAAIHSDGASANDMETPGIDRGLMDYDLAELTGEHFISFIQHAYRQVLKREPDDPGAHAQLQRLAVGTSKAEIIGNLRYSPEGRKVGVRIRGLRWRFLLAKACRVPVLGRVLGWGLALLALPQLMRHQYAQENYFAAQYLAASDRVAGLEQRIDELERSAANRHGRVASLDARLDALESRPAPTAEAERAPEPGPAAGDYALLMHEIQALKHWLFSLQHALDEVEHLTRDGQLLEQQQAWEVSSSPHYQLVQQERVAPWLAALAERVDTPSTTLDLAGPAPWLRGLRDAGLDASGVTAREAWHRHMREQGLPTMLAEPLEHLGKLANHSLDVLSAVALAAALDGATPNELINQAHRVLKPGAWLLLGWQADALQQLHGDVRVADPDLVDILLHRAGFKSIARIDAGDGTPALLAQRGA